MGNEEFPIFSFRYAKTPLIDRMAHADPKILLPIQSYVLSKPLKPVSHCETIRFASLVS